MGHRQRAQGHGGIEKELSVLASTTVYFGMTGEIT
jgi:hypothetical protein